MPLLCNLTFGSASVLPSPEAAAPSVLSRWARTTRNFSYHLTFSCTLVRVLAFLCATLFSTASLFAQTPTATPAPGALAEVAISQLSDRQVTALGRTALSIRPRDWKHAETANFVYHFFQSFIATPVSVEAEYYYRVIAAELGRETGQWERKGHIFIFERTEDWAEFQRQGSLDPWTGGIHAGGELFLQRNPELRWKGSTLGHEVAHLVVHRFFGAGVPLWLNEGYAEYAASRGHASFHRARGYRARPNSGAVDPARFVGLAVLTEAVGYPVEVEEVATFYNESERLVRFLSAANKTGFGAMFDALSKGNRFETALAKGFGSRFASVDALEREFRPYATGEGE